MSPKMKKILMLLGAVVGGYVVYTKVIKKSATPSALNAATAAKLAAVRADATRNLTSVAGTDVIEDLGLSEELGSLGGRRRR
jgi:hypothetical protein